ncbi:Rgg/GadR/MutR family transcriptional regulator [Pseudolactococcus reticulitermitis]|uniref:HTH cro/C1-type domain-containing protein n=1 Tax=Pseudolactococcus reticulitermitis TaxID=2025039 RepID=A0A224X5S0_9LACT|nr:Rgg/GadR/MutR family transcriptional regulator [Lactococcus reticulitermitis]GAX46870.1 hypothetical protein RsY01_450 [Lactococcus reticulitermitis]
MVTEQNSKIDPTLGTVLKLLRKSKGLTIKEAAGNSFSCPHLSNFENGKTEFSARFLLEELKNINVSITEFQAFYDNYIHSKEYNLISNSEITDAYMSHNLAKLHVILKELDSKHNNNRNIKKYHLEVVRIKSLISIIDPIFKVPLDDIKMLKDYLIKLNEWGKYDIELLGQCCLIFDLGTISILTQNMLNPGQTTIKIEGNKHALIQTSINIINLFISKKQFNLARNLINHLETNDIHEYYMYEKLTLIYNTASYNYHKGDKYALETMKKCQQIFEFCQCFKTANLVAEEISSLLKTQ